MSEVSGEVGVDELLDDNSDLALEDGMEEFYDEDETHAEDDQGQHQDDDTSLSICQGKLGEQRLA